MNTKLSKVEDKIPNSSSLVTTTVLYAKISEVENKISHHAKCITTQEFNKLAAENFKERLKQANLVSKIGSNNKLTNFDRKITSNKIKYLEVQEKKQNKQTK